MACNLLPVPPEFTAPSGQQINLFVRDHIGTVLIAAAEYAGQSLVPPGQAVTALKVQIVAGRGTLKIVFAFTASTAGRGELRENCGDGDSHFVRELAGHEPLQILKITGN